MPRIRTIKPEFFSHEDLASKSPHARLLAIGLLTLADCEGRLRWVPMQVHSQVFPWEAEVKIEVLLQELAECEYVTHYEADGKRFVQINNFRKHQRLSGKESMYKSRLPPPPSKSAESRKKTSEREGKQPSASPGSGGNPLGTGEQGNIGTGEHIPQIPSEAPPEKSENQKPKNLPAPPSPEFLSWYALYPKKKARDAAQKAFDRAISKIRSEHKSSRQAAVDWLMNRTKELLPGLLESEERFRPHPATWLNEGSYNDESVEAEETSSPYDEYPEF